MIQTPKPKVKLSPLGLTANPELTSTYAVLAEGEGWVEVEREGRSSWVRREYIQEVGDDGLLLPRDAVQ
jgi:hypothetical protein